MLYFIAKMSVSLLRKKG